MTIGSVSQLVANIRGQLAALDGAKKLPKPQQQQQSSSSSSSKGKPNLEAMIQQRVAQIERDAPNRGRKAFRVFLDVLLISQLGEDLINDPSFHQMVDDVQAAIENNPEMRELVEQATAQLLKPSA